MTRLQQSAVLQLKAETAGALYLEGRISRAECFKHEVAVSTQKDPGPIIPIEVEALHRQAAQCLMPDWISRPIEPHRECTKEREE